MTSSKSIGWVLALATSGALCIACGSGASGESADPPQGSYPITTKDGDTFCSADRGDGLKEVYNFDRINERIFTSEALTGFAAARQLSVVDSCASARIAVEVFKDQILADEAQSSDMVEPEPAPVDKIVDGFTTSGSASAFVVLLDTPVGQCSGALINAHYLLSAAHCFTTAASQFVTVRATNSNGTQTVIGSGTMTITTPTTSRTTCDVNDIALVRWSSGWSAPANTSASWARVFGRQLFTNATTVIYGYGANNGNGSGSRILRRSNSAPTVSSNDVNFLPFVTTGGVGRACSGDSGGPAMTTTTEFPTIAGVSSCMQSSNSCPAVGAHFWYRQTGPVAASFVASTINGDSDPTESCTNRPVSNYNYWTCF